MSINSSKLPVWARHRCTKKTWDGIRSMWGYIVQVYLRKKLVDRVEEAGPQVNMHVDRLPNEFFLSLLGLCELQRDAGADLMTGL